MALSQERGDALLIPEPVLDDVVEGIRVAVDFLADASEPVAVAIAVSVPIPVPVSDAAPSVALAQSAAAAPAATIRLMRGRRAASAADRLGGLLRPTDARGKP